MTDPYPGPPPQTPPPQPQPPYGPPPGYRQPYPQQPYPQQYYGQPPYPAAPPRQPKPPMSTRKLALIVGGCVLGGSLIIGLGLVGLRAMAGSSNNTSDRAVRMVSCGAAGGQFDIVGAQAEIEVTNKSSRNRSYTVTVEFSDSGGTRHATGTANIRNLAPGQTGRDKATSWQGGNSAISNCKISSVRQSGF